MNINLLVTFIILNIINVIIQTVKSLVTVKCGKTAAAVVNAIAYGLYTIVIIYTVCDLPLYLKALIVGLCNLVGVFVVKWAEEKARKDKLWKIELTVKPQYREELTVALTALEIPFNWIDIEKWNLFNIYCSTQEESRAIQELVKKFNAKYFVTETKNL